MFALLHYCKDIHSYLLTLTLYLYQISDLDVSRCREGRLDYLGSASFILIAGLMSCLMVNESIGDAFIDCAMPSFFSSTYLLANVLYNISLLAILCPTSVVLGIFLYHKLVYRYAKKSHKKRKILLQVRKRSGDFGRGEKLLRQKTYKELNRRPRGMAYDFCYFIRRLLVSINDGIVTFIAHVSDKRLKKRVAVEIAHSGDWCAMNKPALHQGTMHSNFGRDSISVVKLEDGHSGKDSANDGHNIVRKRKIVQNPPEIMRMVKASHMWWTVHDGQPNSISGSRARQPLITAQFSCQPLRSDNPSGRRSVRVLRATIFFDTGEALLRILSNLLTPAVYAKGVDNDLKVELFEVPASALLEELQNIFDTFYPDGIPMSEAEKKETCELFSKWILGQDSARLSGTKCSDSQIVSFKAFHGWFYDLSEMIHNSMSERLFTHILLLTNRSNGASAGAFKLLNVVAPKHSNTIYNTYISARPTPVIVPPLKAMYTENYYFGCPLLSRRWYNPRGYDSMQNIDYQRDDDDLYSTYAQRSLGGQLSDSIYPLNNLGGSPRNFTYPHKIRDVDKGDDLYCTYPEGDSIENASPFSHPHRSPKGSPHNIRGLRYPLRKTTRNPVYSLEPH